jgi:hypothetical protein
VGDASPRAPVVSSRRTFSHKLGNAQRSAEKSRQASARSSARLIAREARRKAKRERGGKAP